MSEAKQSVVILYEHALLGEGIAKYLRAHSGVEARVAPGHDLAAVTSALAFGPTVVIFELSEPLRQVDLTALAPQAVLIDVSTVVTRGPSVTPDATGLERDPPGRQRSDQRDPPAGRGFTAHRVLPWRDSRGTRTVEAFSRVHVGLYRKSTVRRMGSPPRNDTMVKEV